jgi:hypothetical protein
MRKNVTSKNNQITSLINLLPPKKNSFTSQRSKISQNSSLKNTISSNNSSNINNNEKLIKRLLEVLKMRISIEGIPYDGEQHLKKLVQENLSLIDLKHIEISSINKFVDDIIELLKKERESNNNYQDRNLFRNTIQFENQEYRPRATSEEKFRRRRTIEIVLVRPKGVSKGPLRFNLFDKDKKIKEEKKFYVDSEELSREGILDFYDMKLKVIEEIQHQSQSGEKSNQSTLEIKKFRSCKNK